MIHNHITIKNRWNCIKCSVPRTQGKLHKSVSVLIFCKFILRAIYSNIWHEFSKHPKYIAANISYGSCIQIFESSIAVYQWYNDEFNEQNILLSFFVWSATGPVRPVGVAAFCLVQSFVSVPFMLRHVQRSVSKSHWLMTTCCPSEPPEREIRNTGNSSECD